MTCVYKWAPTISRYLFTIISCKERRLIPLVVPCLQIKWDIFSSHTVTLSTNTILLDFRQIYSNEEANVEP